MCPQVSMTAIKRGCGIYRKPLIYIIKQAIVPYHVVFSPIKMF